MITLINMSLENKINESIKDSMKSRDTLRLESLRAVKAGILLEKTKTGSKDQVEEAVIPVSYTHLTLPTICSV